MRVPTSDLHAANACWSLFLLSTYLVVAQAASFDKKELCRSDTVVNNVLRRCELTEGGICERGRNATPLPALAT